MNKKQKRRMRSKKQKYRANKREERVLQRAFGKNEHGFSDLPTKISGTTTKRFQNDMGCDFCFPRGVENYNCTDQKAWNDPNWKRYRNTQYRRGAHSAYKDPTQDNKWIRPGTNKHAKCTGVHRRWILARVKTGTHKRHKRRKPTGHRRERPDDEAQLTDEELFETSFERFERWDSELLS